MHLYRSILALLMVGTALCAGSEQSVLSSVVISTEIAAEGENHDQSLPFDQDKAFLYQLGATQTATHWETVFSAEGIVTYYTRRYPPMEYDGVAVDGVADSGTDCWFVGLKPGKVTVTVYKVLDFSNGERSVWGSFTLLVDESLCVTKT